MVKIIGIVLIIFGFACPFLAGWAYYSDIFYSLGILALLSPGKFIPESAKWNRWARVGLLVYLVVILGWKLIFVFELIPYDIMVTRAGFLLLMTGNWIISPFGMLGAYLFRPVGLPDGSYYAPYAHTRYAIAGLMNVVAYVSLGILIGAIRQKCRVPS